MTETTNATVAEHATQTGAIRLNQRSLIGIVGTAEGRRVLVRFPGGRIDTLGVGDRLRPGTITAISEDAVMIGAGSDAQKLTMPPRPAA